MYEASNVYAVFKAFSSPTFPVATPYGPALPSSLRPNPIAYRSGSSVPLVGASQSAVTVPLK